MNIHPDHVRAIERLIPEKKQQAFIDQALEAALKKVTLKERQKPLVSGVGDECMFNLFTDGGSRGNPGRSGGGFVVYKKGELALSGSEYFGLKTNNQSEYLALRLALRQVYANFGGVSIHCYLDSKLVVEQLKGNYKVKSPNVKPLYEELMRIKDQFKFFAISHVPRDQNQAADALANQAMDGG